LGPDGEVLTPEDVFAPELLLLSGVEPAEYLKRLVVTRKGVQDLAVLPLSRKFVGSLGPKGRRATLVRAEVDATEPESILVRVPVPLRRGDERMDLWMEKRYQLQELKSIIGPLCYAWPDFVDPRWHVHCIVSTSEGLTRITPIEECDPVSERAESSAPARRAYLFRSAPTVVGVESQTAGGQWRHQGVLPMPQAKEPVSTGRVARTVISVDLGTTATMLAWAPAEGGKPVELAKPIEYSGRLVPVLKKADGLGERRAWFPNEAAVVAPFLSLFWPFNVAEAKVVGGSIVISKQMELDDLRRVFQSDIQTNLKWERGAMRTDYVKAFLRLAVLQALAETVSMGSKDDEISYTFPTAFARYRLTSGQTLLEDYRTAWSAVSEAIVGVPATPGGTAAIPGHVDGVKFRTGGCSESEAAYFFYLKHNIRGQQAAASRRQLVVDVGGGTSDVYLAPSSGDPTKVGSQVSLRFAGRDLISMMTPRVAGSLHDRSVFELVAEAATEGGAAGLRERMGKHVAELRSTESNMRAAADDVMYRIGEEVPRVLQDLSHRDERVASFLRLLDYAWCGLFYYLGIWMRSVEPRELPDIFIGGNGSRLLYWPTMGEEPSKHGFGRRLLLMYASGADVGPGDGRELVKRLETPGGMDLQLRVSAWPKREVAFGAVWATDISEPDHAEAPLSLGCEVFDAAGKFAAGRHDLCRSVQLAPGIRVAAEEAIERFTGCYTAAGGSRPFKADEIRAMRLDDHANDALRAGEEPPFLSAFTRLLEVAGDRLR
jgi:hypothetical protein